MNIKKKNGWMSQLMRSRNQFEQVTAVSAVACDGGPPPPPPALSLATPVKRTTWWRRQPKSKKLSSMVKSCDVTTKDAVVSSQLLPKAATRVNTCLMYWLWPAQVMTLKKMFSWMIISCSPLVGKKIAVVVFYKKDRMEKQTKKVDKIGMLEWSKKVWMTT